MNEANKTETATAQPENVRTTWTQNDVTELYDIIRSRGNSITRSKLLIALRQLDRELAKRVDEEDTRTEAAQ